MTNPIYAVGDLHGHTEQLEQVLALIEADGGPDAQVVFLGDYVDRGPDSKGVIERLQQGLAAGRNWTCLKGNHDRMFEWFMNDEPRHDPHMLVGYHWLHERIGGLETLASYGLEFPIRTKLEDVHRMFREIVPASHVSFLRELDLYHEHGDLLFVHAGIRPGVALSDQTENDLVWIREPFLEDTRDHPWLVVHGHTALEHSTHFGNRIDLDGGGAFGRDVIPAVFEGRKVWSVTKQGRVALEPS